MSDDPVTLDERRGMAAQKATEIRRRLGEVKKQQAELRRREEELEKFLLAEPAATWEEAADKASYLLTLFAATSTGRDPRRRKIIGGVLKDFARLAGRSTTPAAND